MTNILDDVAEYGWADSNATNAHTYLVSSVNSGLLAAIKKYNLPDKGLKIFDAGCGNGYMTGCMLSQGHIVTGCDASQEGIAVAKKTYPNGVFEVASVYEDLVSKFGNHWDVIISTEVIEHLYDPRKYARNLYEMLRPGGCLIITTPYHGYIKNIVMALSNKLDNHFTALWDGGHIKFWSVSTLTTLLTEAGFKVDSFKGAGRLPLLWKSMVLTASKK